MDRRTLLAIVGVVAVLHVAGGALLMAGARAGSGHFALGAPVAAYLLGARHAFDADHIAAIDNTSRTLRTHRLPTAAIGLWFALGHSAVVVVSCLLLGLGWRSVDTPPLAEVWGPLMSAAFLLAIGGVNLLILRELLTHRHDEDATDRLLAGRGGMMRLLGRRGRLLRRPRHMVLIGVLFGLGLDTATSVGILLLSAGADHASVPVLTYLALPLLFAAGMTLFDCLDSVLMTAVYGWADGTQRRRVGYNLAVTGLSVAAALTIAAVTLARLAAEHGAATLNTFGSIELDGVGFALAAALAAIWVAAASVSSVRQRH